jgi:hypothetical protein
MLISRKCVVSFTRKPFIDIVDHDVTSLDCCDLLVGTPK